MTTLYGNSGYAFTAVGQHGRNEEGDWLFFSHPLCGGLAHFHNHYFYMALVAHFQKAALLSCSARIAEAVANWHYEERDQRGEGYMSFVRTIDAIYGYFLRFTERYWFVEVSNQIQARELFAMWRENLALQKEYDTVRQKLQDIVEYVQAREQITQTRETIKLSDKAGKVAHFALVVAVAALVIGGLGMNLVPGWSFDPDSRFSPGLFVIYLLSIVCLGGAAWCFYRFVKRRIDPPNSQ